MHAAAPSLPTEVADLRSGAARIANALTAENLSYNTDRGSKTVKACYRRVHYRAWGLTAHLGLVCSTAKVSLELRTPHGAKAITPVLAATTAMRSLTIVTHIPSLASSSAQGTQETPTSN